MRSLPTSGPIAQPTENRLEERSMNPETGRKPANSAVSYYLIALVVVVVEREIGTTPAYLVLLILWAGAVALRRATLLGGVGLITPFMFYAPILGRLNLALIDFILPLLLIAAARVSLGDRRAKKPERVVLTYAVCLVTWIGTSYIGSMLLGQTADASVGFLIEIAKLVTCLALFWATCVLVERDFRRGVFDLLTGWIAIATVTACAVTWDMINTPATLVRSTAGFEDPNLLGVFFIASIGVIAIRATFIESRALTILQGGLMLLAIVGTSSRGSMLAAAIVFFALPFCIPTRTLVPRLLSISAVIGVTAIIYQSRMSIPALRRLTETEGLESDIRSDLWAGAVDSWMRNPVFGIGLGNYSRLSPIYTGNEIPFVAHNTYLSFLAETGLIGALIFVSILAYAAWGFLNGWASAPRSFYVVVSLLALAVNMATINGQNARFYWVFLGILIATLAVRRELGKGRTLTSGNPESYVHRQVRESGTASDWPTAC